jgi:peptidylprolyl isomerase
MRLIATLLLTTTALAQTAAKPATPASTPHPATATHASASTSASASKTACAKLPDLSPKLPAVPAGLPCARPLYTITTVPAIKLENVSPLIVPDQLRETLGIASTSFTLAYIDTKIGTGPLAAPHKWYTIRYTGYLTDGTKFDSSYDHPDPPFAIPYGQHHVIPGWDTGFDGMHVGGKRRLFIPYELAYGPNGKPAPPGQTGIPPKAELIFDVELVAQSDSDPTPAPPPPPPPAAKPAPAPPAAAPAPPAATPATPPSTSPKP